MAMVFSETHELAIELLTNLSNQVAGAVKILKATESERLSADLVAEVRTLLTSTYEDADQQLDFLAQSIERKPSRSRIDSITMSVGKPFVKVERDEGERLIHGRRVDATTGEVMA